MYQAVPGMQNPGSAAHSPQALASNVGTMRLAVNLTVEFKHGIATEDEIGLLVQIGRHGTRLGGSQG